MTPESTIFTSNEVSFRYPDGRRVLDKTSFKVRPGEFCVLVGPSGSGKSTLLNLFGLLEEPTQGALYFSGINIAQLSPKQRDAMRRNAISFIFQDFQLLDVLSVWENVEYFLCRQGVPKAERDARVREVLTDVGIADLANDRPATLSGGQKQRVAIARALVKRPAVILADEPTASLDADTAREVMAILRQLSDQHGTTVVVASHDPMVMEFAEKALVIEGEKVLANQAEVTVHAS